MNDVYVVAATRSAIGKARGAFAMMRPDELLASVLRSLVEKVPNCPLEEIEDVIIGCAMPEAEQGMNVARISSLLAGLPDSISAMTLNRFCASGLQAISTAADKIRLGDADIMIAGGVESMSRIPMGGHLYSPSPAIFNSDHVDIAYGMGITAELVAQQWKVSRQRQDAFSLASHEKAIAAIEAGAFISEITPIDVHTKTPVFGTVNINTVSRTVDTDEGPRKGSTLEALARLRSVFDSKGTVTAGNSSQMSDGAACVMLMSEKMVSKLDITPLARFKSYATAGVPPKHMGIGPVEAVPKALLAAGISKNDLDWIELNEAFAAQSLAVIDTLELDALKVNPQGGAIALGHPLGATGAVKTVSLLHGLRQQQKRYGMVTMCIGTGMGAAGIFEAV